MKKVLQEDLENISRSNEIPWEKLKNKSILVTGATGLIGYTLVNALLYANKVHQINMKVYAVVRDREKAEKRFGKGDREELTYIIENVEHMLKIAQKIDYIIHGAGITASRDFVEKPVEVFYVAAHGTENLLKLAKEKNVKGMVYLSSMEVYGSPSKGNIVTENDIGLLSPLIIRNSYPISKVYCEGLCCAYAAEYKLPVFILRLTQTFGPGFAKSDERFFAELMRCVIEKRDIVLRTQGATERSYLYTADAVTAILTVLLKGKIGQAYTAANPATYCSIAEMSYLVANRLSGGEISVRIEPQNDRNSKWKDTLYMQLDVSKLMRLGWKPKVSLEEMFKRSIEGVNCENVVN